MSVGTVAELAGIAGFGLAILGTMRYSFDKVYAQIVGVRTELKGDIGRLETRMDAGFARVEARLDTVEQRTFELSMRLPPVATRAE